MGPLPERSLARGRDRCRRCRGTFGWEERDQGAAQVDGRQPAVRAVGGCPDAIVRVACDARSPRDHFDLDPVGQMDGQADVLTVLVREDHRPLAAIGRVNEDVLSNRNGGARGRSGNGPATGRNECQETSSGECARGARRHGPVARTYRTLRAFHDGVKRMVSAPSRPQWCEAAMASASADAVRCPSSAADMIPPA